MVMMLNPLVLAQLVNDHVAELTANKKIGFFSGKISLAHAFGLLLLR